MFWEYKQLLKIRKIKNMMEYIQRANDDKKYVDRLQIQPKPLEANHVVDLQKQLLAVSIGNFSNGEKLTVNYNNYNEQKNPTFFLLICQTIRSLRNSNFTSNANGVKLFAKGFL